MIEWSLTSPRGLWHNHIFAIQATVYRVSVSGVSVKSDLKIASQHTVLFKPCQEPWKFKARVVAQAGHPTPEAGE